MTPALDNTQNKLNYILIYKFSFYLKSIKQITFEQLFHFYKYEFTFILFYYLIFIVISYTSTFFRILSDCIISIDCVMAPRLLLQLGLLVKKNFILQVIRNILLDR